jgi:putative oxygen-independent coproporphyrinogen III oxidase
MGPVPLPEPDPLDPAPFLRPGTLQIPEVPPLSLYVHFPWCLRKCPYCDFNSHQVAAGSVAFPESAYLDALRFDLESALPLVWGRPVVSVFIGGGTPSLLSAQGVERLLSDIRMLLPVQAGAEVTLEANPSTFEAEKFRQFRAAGVNRLSIGIQSFNEHKLAALGRVHDAAEAHAAVKIAQRHFDNFNLDLMYALPGQSLPDLQQDIECAMRVGAAHLSLYQLTLEANTVFARFPPRLPDEDLAAEMHEWIEVQARDAGYSHYEVSAYARPGSRCRHNLNYWSFGDYLGIGAGAASKLTFPHRVIRQTRLKQPDGYLRAAAKRSFSAESIEVERAELPFEFVLNAMRLTDGFPLRWFTDRTGLPPSSLEPGLATAQSRGLIRIDDDLVQPTELGRRFLSDLQALFLPTRKPPHR